MKCGARCFIVRIERHGKEEYHKVKARTPAGARKIIRREYGIETIVITVKQK